MLETSRDCILRGYGDNNRIIASYAATLFERDDVAYIHVRSARNNCYPCRIDRV